MLAATASDPYTIIAVVLAAIFSLIGALVLIIFNDIRNRLGRVEQHMEGLLWSLWELSARTDGLEDWATDQDPRFHPSRRPFPPQPPRLGGK